MKKAKMGTGSIFLIRGQIKKLKNRTRPLLLISGFLLLSASVAHSQTIDYAMAREMAIVEAVDKASEVQKELTKREQESIEETRESAIMRTVRQIELSGEYRLSAGIRRTGGETDLIWKEANGDLNERNWRILSGPLKANTYDPRIFDRFKLNLDTENVEGFNLHSDITVDPWSFIGKTDRVTVVGQGGDSVEVELKYWSGSRSAINESLFTLQNGDVFSLPEIKVVNGRTLPTRLTSQFNNVFTIPEMQIDREFWPLRELWVDYSTDIFKFRLFPMAYSTLAYTSDDPLSLSNHHIYWEPSPWLDEWKPGIFNVGATPDDFTKGRWSDDLTFFTRDSDLTRLTALRGLSFEWQPFDGTSFTFMAASPKGLWQDYESFLSFPGAVRLKHSLSDYLTVGGLYTYRSGYNQRRKDARNDVIAIDVQYGLMPNLIISSELATSKSVQDRTTSNFETDLRGNVWHISLLGSFPEKDIFNTGYYSIKPDDEFERFIKFRLFYTHMDDGFDPGLASYRETRDDQFWGRHLHFRRPFEAYKTMLFKPSLSYYDIEPFRIGDGVDINRDAAGLRIETLLFDGRFEDLFDVRNVYQADNGKYIETVIRNETTYKITPKLTSKLLGLYHDLPKTKGGLDPFIFDADTGIYFNNATIMDGADPSLKTLSAGLEYAIFDWLSINGVWERTNDSTLAYDNFPRGILNNTEFITTDTVEGQIFRRQVLQVFGQGFFPTPPYSYYDIFKAGLRMTPLEGWELYLDATRNEFKHAGQIDDNINHIGVELAYTPTERLGLFFKYINSYWIDLAKMNDRGGASYDSHHNIFGEIRYRLKENGELSLQFGEAAITPLSIVAFDPFGGSLPTLDTQHIVRIYYTEKF